MPTKTTTHFPPHQRTRRMYAANGVLTGTTVTTHPTPHARSGPGEKVKKQNWSRTPGYKTLRKTQGYLQTLFYVHDYYATEGSPYSGTFRVNSVSPERVEVENAYVDSFSSTTVASVEDQTSTNAVVSALIADCQYRCLSKARDARINLPVFFGEGRQTVKMLQDTVNTLASAYRAFRKGKFNQAAKHLRIDKPFVADKLAANNWMAYRYGWSPLVSDAVGAATLLFDFFEGTGKFKPRTRVTARAKGNPRTGVTYISDHFVQGWHNASHWTQNTSARAGLLLEVEYQSAALASQLGVGLSDPLLTAWELTPFSFVFDWFVDVGGWLEARSSLQGLKVLAGFTSSVIDYQSVNKVGYTNWIFTQKNCDPASRTQVRRYSRNHWNGNVLTLRMPIFDGLNAKRLTDSAAIAAQRLSGDRKRGDPYPISPNPRNRAK